MVGEPEGYFVRDAAGRDVAGPFATLTEAERACGPDQTIYHLTPMGTLAEALYYAWASGR